MKELNKTQKRIYEFLAERSQNGVPPSVREICAAVGLKSTSSVQANLDALEQAGYIERDPMLKRTIRVTGQSAPVTQVPLLGTVTAGMPILAVEAIEGYIPFSGRPDSDKPLFALKVRGDSMIEDGINDGDIAIIKKTKYAENGEIVAASIGEDENYAITLKHFYHVGDRYELHPANSAYKVIVSTHCEIHGKLLMIIRQYGR